MSDEPAEDSPQGPASYVNFRAADRGEPCVGVVEVLLYSDVPFVDEVRQGVGPVTLLNPIRLEEGKIAPAIILRYAFHYTEEIHTVGFGHVRKCPLGSTCSSTLHEHHFSPGGARFQRRRLMPHSFRMKLTVSLLRSASFGRAACVGIRGLRKFSADASPFMRFKITQTS